MPLLQLTIHCKLGCKINCRRSRWLRIETLGFHRLRPDEEFALRLLLSSFDEYPITLRTAAGAIELRRQRKMSLGDALIAATCLEHGLKLATRNAADFDWIPTLSVDSLNQFAV